MRLQTAKHRVVRVLRAVLTLVMFVLIGILSWNFAFQPGLPIIKDPRADLSPKLSASTEGLLFQHSEGDKTFYTLRAKRHDTVKDGPHQFSGVDVTIYGNGTDPERHIASDECSYDPQTGDIEFWGNVVAQLDEITTGRTTALIYRNKGRLAIARSRVTVERPNEMTAAANSMEFGIESGVLKLGGKVHATLASGAEMDADAAVFHQHESWATVTGNVFVRSNTGWARGDDGRAELEPGTFRPMAITIRGNVTAETRSAKNNDVWELKRADKLDLIMNQSGGVERVAAFGQARLEKNAGSESRKLSGGELIAWVDAKGDVDRVEASDGASLDARDGDRITHLTAPKIRINPNGTIVTEGASIAVSADSRITGRDFNIEQGEELSTFTTSLPAKVETQRPGAPTRQMWAERSTTAKIDGKTNRLISLVSVGSVKFIDGDRHGNADKATVTDGGDTVFLEGSASVIDPKTEVYGNQIEIRQRGSEFRAKGAVKTVSKSDSEPVTVTANEAWGSSGGKVDRVNYKGSVAGSVKTESGLVTIKAPEAEGDSTTMTYRGKVDKKVDTVIQTETGLVRIVALGAKGNSDRMTYTGAVELWRERNSVHLTSESLDLWPKQKRFRATGKVESEMEGLKKGLAAMLEYDDDKETARYSENVKLLQNDMAIEASRVVTLTLIKGQISEAVAEGAVKVTRGAATGTGEKAVYEAKGEKVTLTGQPASVVDPARGKTEGAMVTMDRSTGNATVTGAPRGQVTTRAVVPK